jgi:hypothetical protein
VANVCEGKVTLPVRRWARKPNTVALRVVQDNEKGTKCLGVELGHPATGRRKYRDLAYEELRPFSVRKYITSKSVKVKAEWFNSRQMCQKFLMQVMAHKALLC